MRTGLGHQAGLFGVVLLLHIAALAAVPALTSRPTLPDRPLRIRLSAAPAHAETRAPVTVVPELAVPRPGTKRTAPTPLAVKLSKPHARAASPARLSPSTLAVNASAALPPEVTHESVVSEPSFRWAAGVSGHAASSYGRPTEGPVVPGIPLKGPEQTSSPVSAPAVDTDLLLRDYSAKVISRIKAQQRYPASAEKDGVEGKVKVSFAVSADGGLLSASVSSSSGNAALDTAALAAVQDAAPFAPIPAALKRSSAKLSVTLKFHLK